MKKINPCLALLFCMLFPAIGWTAGGSQGEPEIGKQLVEGILADGQEQLDKIYRLSETGSDQVREILTTWRQGDLFVHQHADGRKVPFTLDKSKVDQGVVHGKQVENGEVLLDENNQPLNFHGVNLVALDTTSKIRKTIKSTLDLLSLSHPNPQTRKSAVMKLGMEQKKEYLPVLQSRLEKEKHGAVRKALHEAISIIELNNPDEAVRIKAIQQLAGMNSISAFDLIKKLGDSDPQSQGYSPEVAASAKKARQSLESHIFWVDFYGTIFRGLSLGSILLVVALGLAITFGLMGVINMAHGELIVVGGYAAFLTQNLFVRWFGNTGLAYELYFVAAIPVAFLSAALVGLLLERSIIQFLYKRPLESLLATWGVSLVLQQAFRLFFGAANVQVNSPKWLSGNFTLHDVIFGYNRLFVIAFAGLIVLGTWLLLTRTSLGLLIRAVMQNRNMAACLGVKTERVNMFSFAFGSGLAGLAGAFLSQIGNVGPGLGQTYIVDSFMTVVLGGVGNLLGTIVSAFGIGVVDQTLQPFLGPVMGKITVLAAIILFLQWRPAGIFVTRSRSLD